MTKPTWSLPASATAHIPQPDLDELFATIDGHMRLFAGFTMQDDDDAAPPPAEQEAAGAPEFPAGTPLAEMTDAQQAAYWRDKARKHEGVAKSRRDYDAIKAELDQLKQSSMTADEKAVADARAAGEAAGRAEALASANGRIVRAELTGALRARGVVDTQIASAVGAIDPAFFLADDGEVDTDKVSNYAAGFAPSGGGDDPDMGQGRRGGTPAASGVGAGRDLHRTRIKK